MIAIRSSVGVGRSASHTANDRVQGQLERFGGDEMRVVNVRAKRHNRLRVCAAVSLLMCGLTMMPLRGQAQPSDGWWGEDALIGYGLVTLGGGLLLLPSLVDTPSLARIGPVYDPAHPTAIFDPKYSAEIGKPYAEEGAGETVPTAWMGYALGAGVGWLAVQELAPWIRGTEPDAQRLHDTLVGYAEGLALTLGVMEVLKVGVGRLRPDFQARALRYHCHTDVVPGLPCDGTRPLDPDPARARWLLNDGRKSLPSGHAGTAAYLSAYLVYAIGGRYVWSEDATPTSRVAGILAQTTLIGAAVWTARSRVTDGRHHLGDVLTGGAIGLTFASLAYWRRFTAAGRLRRPRSTLRSHKAQTSPGPSPVSWQLAPAMTGRGLALQGRF